MRQAGIPRPATGEALIEVLLSGICGTDLHMVGGYYPFAGILGHEFVGRVREVNASQAECLVGKRVVGEINTSCQSCRLCRKNRPSHCLKRDVLGLISRNGSHAQFVTLPIANLHVVPDSVPDECAVFAEPLAAALRIQSQVVVSPAAKVLVLGAGRLGQLVSWCLANVGVDLLVVARHAKQMKLLAERGITYCSEVAECHENTFDVVVECTGSPSGFAQAVRCVVAGGTIVLKSTYPGTPEMPMSQVVVKEILVVGSRCGPLDAALRVMDSRQIDPRALIEEVFPLSRGLDALQRASVPSTFKVLLSPSTQTSKL